MRTFEEAHPELMPTVIKTWGSVAGLRVYSDYKDGKLTEMWERNEEGVLVDVTERELARIALEEAKEAFEKARLQVEV